MVNDKVFLKLENVERENCFVSPKVQTMTDYSGVSTAALAKHVFEHLPSIEVPQHKSASEQTATKAVALGTALLFLKIWITTSIEGTLCLCVLSIDFIADFV